MPQRQQSIAGVFGVEMVIGPVTIKSSLGCPEAVDKVEADLADVAEGDLQSLQRMQCRGGAEQIRQWRARCGQEATAGCTCLSSHAPVPVGSGNER